MVFRISCFFIRQESLCKEFFCGMRIGYFFRIFGRFYFFFQPVLPFLFSFFAAVRHGDEETGRFGETEIPEGLLHEEGSFSPVLLFEDPASHKASFPEKEDSRIPPAEKGEMAVL